MVTGTARASQGKPRAPHPLQNPWKALKQCTSEASLRDFQGPRREGIRSSGSPLLSFGPWLSLLVLPWAPWLVSRAVRKWFQACEDSHPHLQQGPFLANAPSFSASKCSKSCKMRHSRRVSMLRIAQNPVKYMIHGVFQWLHVFKTS